MYDCIYVNKMPNKRPMYTMFYCILLSEQLLQVRFPFDETEFVRSSHPNAFQRTGRTGPRPNAIWRKESTTAIVVIRKRYAIGNGILIGIHHYLSMLRIQILQFHVDSKPPGTGKSDTRV